MNNKALGITLIVIGIVLITLISTVINGLERRSVQENCMPSEECRRIESKLEISHIIFGVMGFIFALGIYLLFFTKGDEAILKRLEENKKEILDDEKFNILLRALSQYEKTVMKIVREQEGITQNTLRIRADMSKAKLSYVLQDLEKKGLIKRVKKNKSLAIFLKV